jgi:Holliday junction resolvase
MGRVPVTNYQRGVRLERDTVNELKAAGFVTIRAASSKGVADVVGFRPGQVLFIQAKTDGRISPADRVCLLRLAEMVPGGLAVVVHRPKVAYRLLVGTGSKEWVPTSLDSLGLLITKGWG